MRVSFKNFLNHVLRLRTYRTTPQWQLISWNFSEFHRSNICLESGFSEFHRSNLCLESGFSEFHWSNLRLESGFSEFHRSKLCLESGFSEFHRSNLCLESEVSEFHKNNNNVLKVIFRIYSVKFHFFSGVIKLAEVPALPLEF